MSKPVVLKIDEIETQAGEVFSLKNGYIRGVDADDKIQEIVGGKSKSHYLKTDAYDNFFFLDGAVPEFYTMTEINQIVADFKKEFIRHSFNNMRTPIEIK
jgi:hypothetical protein